jgi:hypothetical protein
MVLLPTTPVLHNHTRKYHTGGKYDTHQSRRRVQQDMMSDSFIGPAGSKAGEAWLIECKEIIEISSVS